MYQYTFRKLFIASGALAVFSVIVIWSFNELSELFGGPQAQFKHAIAAIGILLVIKWIVTRSGRGHERRNNKHRRLRSSRDNVHDH
jgi:hypothetical protein